MRVTSVIIRKKILACCRQVIYHLGYIIPKKCKKVKRYRQVNVRLAYCGSNAERLFGSTLASHLGHYCIVLSVLYRPGENHERSRNTKFSAFFSTTTNRKNVSCTRALFEIKYFMLIVITCRKVKQFT